MGLDSNSENLAGSLGNSRFDEDDQNNYSEGGRGGGREEEFNGRMYAAPQVNFSEVVNDT